MCCGINIDPDAIRFTIRHNHRLNKIVKYNVLGIIPRQNEPIIWNNPRALRTSVPGPTISISQLWEKFLKDDRARAKYNWKNSNDFSVERPISELIAEAIRQNLKKDKTARIALAIDNTLPEFHQESLLRSLRLNGFVNVELIWRPICIALHHLDNIGRNQYNEGDKIAIVDLDCFQPELTILELKKQGGELVPLRNLPSKHNQINSSYSIYQLRKEFIKNISNKNTDIEEQLQRGAYSKEFFAFLDGKKAGRIWIRKGLEYSSFQLYDNWRKQIGKYKLNGENFDDLQKSTLKILENKSVSKILWNGFLCRSQNTENSLDSDSIVNAFSISNGASIYSQLRQKERPTYLDTLPGLEILSKDEESQIHKLYPVINPGVVEGGKIERIPKPLTKFSLEEGTEKFTAVLYNIAEDKYKKLITTVPKTHYESHVPLIIRAEMRPANGHAQVTIEGDENHTDVFGRKRTIKLDWQTMDDFEPETYSGPEVYPIQGRIADDPECLRVARLVVKNGLNLGSRIIYRNHSISYASIHEPWGYTWPWGDNLGESTRALFGAHLEDDPEIKKLAEKIGLMIQNTVSGTKNRHKFLNYMFRYAPTFFLDELRILFKLSNPKLNMNSVYAVGRTFYRSDDYELFLDFIIKISRSRGYPFYKNDYYTKAFFWSFFRALCYYDDTVKVPRKKVETVLSCIYNYSLEMADENWRAKDSSNMKKYLLCSILFSIRLRKIHRDFLLIDTDLCNQMVEVIKDFIPAIHYPPTMFAEPQNDFLNDYVYRFLANEATKQDLDALQGLVVTV